MRTEPPFRADHVGSLLRPDPLKAVRAKAAKGIISRDALREAVSYTHLRAHET